VNPSYLDGDFNGDGKIEVAVLVKQRSTGKLGIAIIHGGTGKVAILGAGNGIGNGGDDFEWMDYWQLYPKGRTSETTAPQLRGDALLVGKSEAASTLILERPALRLVSTGRLTTNLDHHRVIKT